MRCLASAILPAFGQREISTINRSDIEFFLADRAQAYCKNTLRGMRISLGRVLSWAVACDWIEKNPCSGVALPQAGKRVKRTVLKPEQVLAIASALEEPYFTLVLFLASTGLRTSEAAIRWEDFDGDVLHVHRRLYDGQVDTPKTASSERHLPLPQNLLSRLRELGGSDWAFRSNLGGPINPGNALRRYARPVVSNLGIQIGGWHDFRHTLITRLRKLGWAPKVTSQIVGHSTIRVTEEIYDHADADDFRSALNEVAFQLEPDGTQSAVVN
jgi:integrase